jgi:hypothetical protein
VRPLPTHEARVVNGNLYVRIHQEHT